MKNKVVIGLFLAGLLLMVILERALIWVFDELICLPTFVYGQFNLALGLLLISFGIFLIIWSVWAQFTIGKGTPVPRVATQKLVVEGPYAYTRNPMTLGAAAFYIGISVWYGSLTAFLLVILIFGSLLTFIYFHETRELSDRFGDEYLAYRKKTPFLIPHPKIKRD